MKENKNAFTLIELLAIIVILAIIAVITVPIILNIIDNARKGAATNSAYGFKDAVNKWYVDELSTNHNFTLKSEYTVLDGEIIDANNKSVLIPASGTKPSSGYLNYTNTELKGGCLTVGDYKVTFKNDGSVDKTEKGTCTPRIATCPGCKYIFIHDYLEIGVTTMESLNTTDDYTELTSGENSPQRFLGLLEDENTGKIGRAFACGIENGKPFCIEGYDQTKWTDGTTAKILNTVYPSCNASVPDDYASCYGSTVGAGAYDYGDAFVDDDDGYCIVYGAGAVGCQD